MDHKECLAEARKCFAEALTITGNPQSSGEDHTKAERLLAAGKDWQRKAEQVKELTSNLDTLDTEIKALPSGDTKAKEPGVPKFASLREYWKAVCLAGNVKYRGELHPALGRLEFKDSGDKVATKEHTGANGWEQKTTMAENTGATGGFLVPDEFRAELYSVPPEDAPIRSRATVIPMSRRSLRIPVLNQVGTTAGQPHWFGGMLAYWTEEGQQKSQSDPTFKQIELTAHKLVCYTRSTDEMLDDTAISLDAFLRGPLGFTGVINWFEEWKSVV